ncbi:hypothetical protein RRG08_013602 [Elysia crispata]|uniref:Uncharacterized protein n=1 Tax=Elysia crispata TaxID=231223 RepID=A0AAE1A8S9_9GAST|nr:hypothetical protein RRG08_013602 [Elysia crispata]
MQVDKQASRESIVSGLPVEAQCEHRTDLGADSLSRYAIWRGCLPVICARPALRTISSPPLELTPLTHHRLHTRLKGDPEFIMSKQSSADVEPQLRRWNKFLKLSATPEANRVARNNENRVLRAREPSVVSSSSTTFFI